MRISSASSYFTKSADVSVRFLEAIPVKRTKNAQDGISMVQTFEGALTETDSILQRMKTLADQMANGTYDDPEQLCSR